MITIENLSPSRRKHWCAVKVPRQQVNWFDTELLFRLHNNPARTFRAYAGRVVGSKAIVYIEADLDGHEIVAGDIEVPNIPTMPFVPHPWVLDDWSKLIMQAGFRIEGLDVWSSVSEWQLQIDTPVLKRWWIRALGPHGLVFEAWADMWTGDPVVDIYAKVVWSDRSDLSWNKIVEAVWLKCGESLVLDFATRHGIVGGARIADGSYLYLLGRDVPFSDGSALPISGAMLCFRDHPDTLNDQQVGDAVRNLMAASQGPVLGIADHAGHWQARGNIARVRAAELDQQATLEWNRFVSSLASPAGWFPPRPVGCTSTPGQTGAQEDFGATKGTFAVATLSPKHIYRLRYGVQADLFRGCQHYETGKPLALALHPRWVTLSMITHYHTGVSPDRIGKETPRPPAHGWVGYDAQHRSQNNLAAYLALVDDPLMLDHCEHMLTTDFADYRRRFPQNGADAARGQGRPVGTWAQLLHSTGNERFASLIAAQVQQSYEQMLRLGTGNVMRVLSWIGPDGRVPLYVNGVLAPTVSMWEHGLAIVGFYLAHHVVPTSAWLDAILGNLAELLATYGLHEDANGFRLATSIHWNDGNEPLAYLWDSGSGVGGWLRAGLLVAREWLDHQHPMWDKLDRYLRQTTSDPETRVDWAEWWAVVNSQANAGVQA